MAPSQSQKALDLIQAAGVIRPRDLKRWGISRAALQRLVRRGDVERVGRGLYLLADADVTEHHSRVEAAETVADCFRFRNQIGLVSWIEELSLVRK